MTGQTRYSMRDDGIAVMYYDREVDVLYPVLC